MRLFTRHCQIVLFTLFLFTLMISCSKENNSLPNETVTLLEKVYLDDKLHLELFYDRKHTINRIDHYVDGKRKSRRDIQLNERGFVKKVILSFEHYTSMRTLNYDGDRKVGEETDIEFDDGSLGTSMKREWKYPKVNVIEDLLYSDDAVTVNYISTFTFLESGNLQKKERKVIKHPNKNTYEEYQYDTVRSFYSIIENNIPGYSEMPVSKNQLLNAKRYKPSGELISESIYTNSYNKEGLLEAYSVQTETSSQVYRLQYMTVAK